jgi:hypothetical protein
MGFRTSVARSTLADANEARDWRIFVDFSSAFLRGAHQVKRVAATALLAFSGQEHGRRSDTRQGIEYA